MIYVDSTTVEANLVQNYYIFRTCARGRGVFWKNQGRKADSGDRARKHEHRTGRQGTRRLAETAARARQEGEGRGRGRGTEGTKRTGGKDGHFGTRVDKMARKWTIWQGKRGWHGDCNIQGENVLTRACIVGSDNQRLSYSVTNVVVVLPPLPKD